MRTALGHACYMLSDHLLQSVSSAVEWQTKLAPTGCQRGSENMWPQIGRCEFVPALLPVEDGLQNHSLSGRPSAAIAELRSHSVLI